MHDLTAFQRDLLFITAGLNGQMGNENPHGLAIKKHVSEYYQEPINHGRLYPNLDELVSKGLLSKTKKDERTNGYAITERGKREIADRMEWQQENAPRP